MPRGAAGVAEYAAEDERVRLAATHGSGDRTARPRGPARGGANGANHGAARWKRAAQRPAAGLA